LKDIVDNPSHTIVNRVTCDFTNATFDGAVVTVGGIQLGNKPENMIEPQ